MNSSLRFEDEYTYTEGRKYVMDMGESSKIINAFAQTLQFPIHFEPKHIISISASFY